MNKRIAGLLGGVAALATLNAAQAAAPAPGATTSLAAQSYAELLEPVPNALPRLIADDAARAQLPARVQLAQYHHHHHHHHHHHGFFPGAALGVLGGIIAAQPRYYEPAPVYAAPPPGYDEDEAYCMRRFKSYDPESGTYLGFDGYRHPCP